MRFEDELRNLRTGLKDADPQEALTIAGKYGWDALNRADVAPAADSSSSEKIGATMALYGTEACARITVLSAHGDLDHPEVERLIAEVGGALDEAQDALARRDTPGLTDALEKARIALGLP